MHLRTFLFSLILILALANAGCSTGKKKIDDGEVHYILGLSYLQEHNPTLALREFLLAQDFAPRDARVQVGLGQAYHLKGAYPQAEQHYLNAVRLSRGDPKFQNNLGALYLDMQRWDDAISYFSKAASNLLFPTPELALTGMGYAYFHQGEYAKATTAMRDALGHNPRFAQARLGLGEVFFAQEETERAIVEFRQALAIAPDFSTAHYKLGLAYLKIRQTEKAFESFQQVVRRVPDTEIGRLSQNYLELLK
jgi:Tfp pilus assembly protein PilF